MFKGMQEDVRAVFDRDPAARHWFEVITTSPGLHAIWIHRVSHALALRPEMVSSVYRANGAIFDRHRDPPRRENWSSIFYRSWDGCCDRRDR